MYLANGEPGSGTLVVSWPAFTTATGQSVAADKTTVTIAADGFLSVNLAPNQGATPAGLYYTAVFYMSDGTVNTQYWMVPAMAQATLAQVQTQVMPAAQAVQAVSKGYVDQTISELTESLLTASGGNLSGPLYLNGDPTQPMQAATKHYVDNQVGTAVPLAGGNMSRSAEHAGDERGAGAGGGEHANHAAGGDERGGSEWGDGDSAGLCRNGQLYEPERGAGNRPAETGAQQMARSVKEFGAVCDGVTDDTNALQAALNYANAHGVALTIPAGNLQDASVELARGIVGGVGKTSFGADGISGAGCARGGNGRDELSELHAATRSDHLRGSEHRRVVHAGGRTRCGGKLPDEPADGDEFDFLAGREWADGA